MNIYCTYLISEFNDISKNYFNFKKQLEILIYRYFKF